MAATGTLHPFVNYCLWIQSGGEEEEEEEEEECSIQVDRSSHCIYCRLITHVLYTSYDNEEFGVQKQQLVGANFERGGSQKKISCFTRPI